VNSHKYYQVLGLYEGASMSEIKAAYRRLALRYHPDKNASKHDQEKFKVITEAYRILRTDYALTSSSSSKSNCKENLSGMKISYWNELNLEKIFDKHTWYYGYTKSYRRVSKYEQKLCRYYKELRHASTAFPSTIKDVYLKPFLTLDVHNHLLKNTLQSLKSKFRFR